MEITKLSLWLKTAERGKKLTFLDENIHQGDSIVSDVNVTPEAFDWCARFPHIFDEGGFDVVIGNPPYVRQELLGPIKPYLSENYESYDGVADLYTYFYERGVDVLKTGGILSFIVTNQWIILLKSSQNETWPWADAEDPVLAEAIFQTTYPSVYNYMKPLEERLKKRSDQGKFWWELRNCAYYDSLVEKKIIWQDLSFHSRFCLDADSVIPDMTCFSLPSSDSWLLAVLNSPLMWSYLWRNTIHGKDEVLRLKTVYMDRIPIAPPRPENDEEAAERVQDLIDLTMENQRSQNDLIEWMKLEMDVSKPGAKLSNAADMDSEAFAAEIKKRRPRGSPGLGVGDVKRLREAYNETVPKMQQRNAKTLRHERRLSDLVNKAYNLTPDEVSLMWKTAPPRTPLKE